MALRAPFRRAPWDNAARRRRAPGGPAARALEATRMERNVALIVARDSARRHASWAAETAAAFAPREALAQAAGKSLRWRFP